MPILLTYLPAGYSRPCPAVPTAAAHHDGRVDPMFGLDGAPVSGVRFDSTVLWRADLLDEDEGKPDRG